MLYPNPGYPIYESQIKYNDGVALPYAYIPTSDGFMIDREKLESMINENTRLLIYNNYHNISNILIFYRYSCTYSYN